MKIFRSVLFWLFFVVPMALGTTYYLKYASKQYQSSAHFTIEKSGQTRADPLGLLTGLPGNVSSTQDALIIKDFIESSEVIARIKDQIDIKKLYARDDKDWLSRLDKDASLEDVLEYWKKKVKVEFNTSSGIINLKVLAFEPQDTIKIINAVLKSSENLVNNLSDKARQDGLSFARKELSKAENNLKVVRAKIRSFRDKEQALSPEKNIEMKMSLVAKLEADLAQAEAELRGLSVSLQDRSPKVRAAKNKVYALKKQIKKERNKKIYGSHQKKRNSKSVAAIVSQYEELLTEQDFAEKAYASTLLNMEKSRIDATQKHRYLTVIVQPQLPEEATKPNIPDDIIVLFLYSLLAWGILALVIAAIRDHAGWV